MANSDSAFGLVAVRNQNGSDPNGNLVSVMIPASTAAAFIGTPVKLQGSADTDSRLPTAITAGTGDVVYGVVAGFAPNPDNLMSKHRAAADAKRIARVVLATPTTVFKVQADALFPITEVGQNFDLTAESGTAATGRSTVELSVTSGTTSTAQVQCVGISRDPDTEFGTAAGTNVFVTFNESDTATATAI